MRMLDMDIDEISDLSKITQEEAFKFLEEGLEIVCQTDKRDFHEITKVSDLMSVLNLEKEGVYENLKFYVK